MCENDSPICWCPCSCGWTDRGMEGQEGYLRPNGLCPDCDEGNHEIPPEGILFSRQDLIRQTESYLAQLKEVVMSEPHRFEGDPPVTADRVDEFIGRRKKYHFSVAPRFTPGSPGVVDFTTAQKVASEEAGSFVHARVGRYGERLQERAEKHGLTGICEVRVETRKGWEVLDLCTGDVSTRERST